MIYGHRLIAGRTKGHNTASGDPSSTYGGALFSQAGGYWFESYSRLVSIVVDLY